MYYSNPLSKDRSWIKKRRAASNNFCVWVWGIWVNYWKNDIICNNQITCGRHPMYCIFTTLPNRKVMKIKKILSLEILSWYNIKCTEGILTELKGLVLIININKLYWSYYFLQVCCKKIDFTNHIRNETFL